MALRELLPRTCAYATCHNIFKPRHSKHVFCCPAHAHPRLTLKQRDQAALNRAIQRALRHGTSPAQIETWTFEFLTNAIDYFPDFTVKIKLKENKGLSS